MTRDGNQVSVLALARRLALANTTFRRNFPDVVEQLAQQAPAAACPSPPTRPDGTRDYAHDNAVLRTQNRHLRHQLELACAQIQRLALENDQLRSWRTPRHGSPASNTGSAGTSRPGSDAPAFGDHDITPPRTVSPELPRGCSRSLVVPARRWGHCRRLR
jgi:hypothetical protein